MKNYKVNILVILLIITFISSFLAKKITAENVLAERLAGRILLQVENNGEAWYVNPNDFKRYYLGRPQDAFNLMRDLGLGVKNIDINKIALAKANFNGLDTDKDGLPDNIEISIGTDINNPDSDSDGYTDKEEALNNFNPKGEGKLIIDNKLAKDLAGRILLQVENNGEAWYVNPNDFKRYYLGRPQDAFDIMRKLGLGITNNDLAKINEHIIKPEYSSENIVENNTILTENNMRKYISPENNYSFAYPSDWKIKKYESSPNVVYLTDANRDFILEDKSVIFIQYIETSDDYDVNKFRIADKE